VHKQRPNGSLVELARFNLENFDLKDKGVAALFGVVLARLAVARSYLELMGMQLNIEYRATKPPIRH